MNGPFSSGRFKVAGSRWPVQGGRFRFKAAERQIRISLKQIES